MFHLAAANCCILCCTAVGIPASLAAAPCSCTHACCSARLCRNGRRTEEEEGGAEVNEAEADAEAAAEGVGAVARAAGAEKPDILAPHAQHFKERQRRRDGERRERAKWNC